jgi:hypothetical protein
LGIKVLDCSILYGVLAAAGWLGRLGVDHDRRLLAMHCIVDQEIAFAGSSILLLSEGLRLGYVRV